MAYMTENQVRLLNKLQLADLPAFRDINPVTINQDEAAELFKNNLPMLEYIISTRFEYLRAYLHISDD